MSMDNCYDALMQIWLIEDVRLADNIIEIEQRIFKFGYDRQAIIEYIEACAKRQYFKEYIWELLRWLKPYCDK